MTSPAGLILASTSPYRRELLSRLRLPVTAERPEVDEAPLAGELPGLRAARLALAKAAAVAARHPEAVVIGADQVAECGGRILDKPGSAAAAREQLRAQSGRSASFHSAVAVVQRARGYSDCWTDVTTVVFRALSAAEIAAYVEADEPYDCAGSLRSEGLGACLCERIETADPTALVGLPLIRLAASLRSCGYALP